MTWKKTLCFAAALAAGVIVPQALGESGAGSTNPQTKTSKSYVFKLSIGMAEKMWTPAQVRSQHPKTGEVMLMGAMGGGMSMAGAQRHVEVHISSRATGKVVSGATPVISVTDTTMQNAQPMKIPVAEMQGVDAGAADLHYGNNVALFSGHLYRIAITLKGERVVFRMTSPKA